MKTKIEKLKDLVRQLEIADIYGDEAWKKEMLARIEWAIDEIRKEV